MSTVKDVNDVEYTVHESYSRGDVTFLSTGATNIAYRMPEDVLKAKRDMLVTVQDPSRQISLPSASNDATLLFLHVLTGIEGPLPTTPWSCVDEAIRLAAVYECGDVQRRMLRAAVPLIDSWALFKPFAAASQLDDVYCGAMILCKGRGAIPLLSPVGPAGWSGLDADKVTSRWIWALSNAIRDAERRFKGVQDPFNDRDFWHMVGGGFLDKLR